MSDYKQCPFKKIVETDIDIFGKKTTEVTFGECEWQNCMAAKTYNDCSGHTFFEYCRLIKNEKK